MEDNFNQTDFEEFLKEQVKNHRMYPSDTVWRDISKNLHGDKKWPALTIAAFTLLSATIAICIHFTSKPDIFAIKPADELKISTLKNYQDNTVLNNLPSSASLYKENKLFPLQPQRKEATTVSPVTSMVNPKKEVIHQNKIAATKGLEDKNTIEAQTGNVSAEKHVIPKIIDDHIDLNSRAEKKDLSNYSN